MLTYLEKLSESNILNSFLRKNFHLLQISDKKKLVKNYFKLKIKEI